MHVVPQELCVCAHTHVHTCTGTYLHACTCSLVVSNDRLIVATNGMLVSYIAVEWSLGMKTWVFCVIYVICHLSPPCGGGRQVIGV